MLAAVNPVVGGAGGMPHRERRQRLRRECRLPQNTPIEITEAEVPIQVLRYGLLPDSGGAGRWRGGLATVMEFRVFAPNSRVIARNRDRSHFRPWGILRGQPGASSSFVINPGAARERELGNTDTLTMDLGDVLHIHSHGACPAIRCNPSEDAGLALC